MTRRWASKTRYTFQRNKASIMKGLVCDIIRDIVNIQYITFLKYKIGKGRISGADGT